MVDLIDMHPVASFHALAILVAAGILMFVRNDRRQLDGFTRTGSRQSRGQEVPALPGGGIDWSRPRCEPDNSLRAILGRLAPFLLIQIVGLPIALGGLWAVNQEPVTRATGALIEAMPGGVVAGALQLSVLFVLGLLAIAFGVPAWTRSLRGPAGARVEVAVHSMSGPLDAGIARGQLVFRRYDSPALTPAAATPPALPPGVDDDTLWCCSPGCPVPPAAERLLEEGRLTAPFRITLSAARGHIEGCGWDLAPTPARSGAAR